MPAFHKATILGIELVGDDCPYNLLATLERELLNRIPTFKVHLGIGDQRGTENASFCGGKLALGDISPRKEACDALQRAGELCHPGEVDAMAGFNQRGKIYKVILQRLH